MTVNPYKLFGHFAKTRESMGDRALGHALDLIMSAGIFDPTCP